MPEYKLTYYNYTGLGEPIRYIFAIAGVPYEDHRIPKDEKHYPVLPPEIKNELPWGSMPVLEYDGKVIAQSLAIARFLARKFNLAGADDYEAAKCDEYVDAIKDFGHEWHPLVREKDTVKKLEVWKNIKEFTIPKLGKFNSIIEKNGGKWLVGSKVTWADLYVDSFITRINTHGSVILSEKLNIADGYPALENMIKSVHAIPQIKEWVQKSEDNEILCDFSYVY